MLLKDKLNGKKLILASKSPRRKELLTACGIPFQAAPEFDTDESWPTEVPINEVAAYVAAKKAKAYPLPVADNEILLTADTVVVLGDKILGKPADREEAARMLSELSENSHTVITGVCIKSSAGNVTFSSETEVYFRRLTEEEIYYYIDNYSPYDKAGAYGIQEWIGYAGIEKVVGSFYNVMGLPIQKLYVNLDKLLNQ